MVAVSPVVVGRTAEIAVLGESWALARGGSPATVLIGGEAGIGKTRLVRHFTAGVEAEVLYGGCVDLSGSGLPFAPFTAALRGHADTPAKLLPWDVQVDSDTARARLFEEMLTRLAGLCARRPVVLVIEDIHWIDRSSLDLLSFLVHNQQAAGALLCVVTYRSDELELAHPLRRSLAELDRISWTRRMELPRLARRAVGSLVGAIAGAEPAASVVAEIYRRSEGNPFFAEVLLDRQDQPGLPESLRDLLLARVARLPAPTQAVLRMAAAGVGRVSHELLAAASGLDDGALSASLRPAVAAGVLVVDGDGYRFRHALISEAVRDDQLPVSVPPRIAGLRKRWPPITGWRRMAAGSPNWRFTGTRRGMRAGRWRRHGRRPAMPEPGWPTPNGWICSSGSSSCGHGSPMRPAASGATGPRSWMRRLLRP